jgi:hypothetical protein
VNFDPPLVAPISDYFIQPNLAPDGVRDAAFDELLLALRDQPAIRTLDYRLPYPKHEFLRYVAEDGRVLLHGSNDASIELMSPVRRTIDARRTHSESAVFACADGFWALHYALLDRTPYRGTLRNDARLMRNPDGVLQRAYFFSVNTTAAWRSGVVYLLNPGAFSRLGDETSLEWASAVAVLPMAKLDVSPSDFPLFDRVRTHDDSPLNRLRELSVKLVTTHAGFEELPDGYVIRYPQSEQWASEARELIALLRSTNPWLEGDVSPAGDGVMQVRLAGSPALKDMLGNGLRNPRV